MKLKNMFNNQMFNSKLKKIISVIWFPLGLLLLFSGFYLQTHQQNRNTLTFEGIDFKLHDFNGNLNGVVEIDISSNLNSLCGTVKDKPYYITWLLIIIFLIGDFLFWLKQFVVLPHHDEIYNGVMNSFTMSCVLYFIFYVFTYSSGV